MSFEFSVTPYLAKKITMVCKDCGKTVREETWEDYAEYRSKMARLKQVKICPHCAKATMMKGAEAQHSAWKRTSRGDWQAVVKNGDFLVYKLGNSAIRWRWRFRKHGETYPERIQVAETKEEAMKACEQHEEWKV